MFFVWTFKNKSSVAFVTKIILFTMILMLGVYMKFYFMKAWSFVITIWTRNFLFSAYISQVVFFSDMVLEQYFVWWFKYTNSTSIYWFFMKVSLSFWKIFHFLYFCQMFHSRGFFKIDPTLKSRECCSFCGFDGEPFTLMSVSFGF